MDSIKLSTDLVNTILQYLGNQKFVEVAGLVQAIQQQAQGIVVITYTAASNKMLLMF